MPTGGSTRLLTDIGIETEETERIKTERRKRNLRGSVSEIAILWRESLLVI